MGDRPPRSRLRTWIPRLVLALVLLLAIIAGLIAAAPWLARPTIEQALGAALGQPVSITALRWDAANRSVVAEGVTVGEAPDLFGVERITIRANPVAFDRRHLIIDQIAFEKPFGVIALDNQYRPALGAAADSDGGPPSLPLALTVREVVVGEGTILIHRPEPGAPAATVVLERLSASDIEFADGVLSFSGALAATVNTAPLSGEATVRLAPDDRTIRATLTVKKVPLRAGLVPMPAAVESLTGTLEATAELDLADQPPRQDLRLALRLANARLSGPRGAQLAAASIALPKAHVDLIQRRIDLGPVTVEKPQLTLDLAAAEDAAAPAAAPSEPAWSLRTDTVTVRGGELRARRGDASATLRLDTVRWQGLRDTPTTLSLTARAVDGGRLQADGTVSVEPFGFDLALRAEALSVASWARLVELPLHPARGSVTGTLRLDYRDGLRRIEGTLRADDLHSAPPDPARPTEVMAVATAEATFAVVPDGNPAVEVSALRLDYPYVMVVRSAAGTFPYSVLGVRAAGDEQAPPAPAAAMPEVRVRRVAIDNGKVEFVDETVAPPFWTSLTSLSGSAEGIALPALTIDRFVLSGKRDELSPVEIAGAITAEGLQGRVAVQDILLDSLNAYIAPVLGYRVVSGRLSTVATATSVPSLLQSTAEVVLNGLDVTQIGHDVIYQQSGVPLPIALGLISGPGGQIDLTLPLSVDISSGQVAVGSVVWQAVSKAIVTALTSPLRILGNLFGGKGAPHAFAIDPIPFATGSAAIDAAAAQRIGEIARILAAQPGLLLVIQPQLTAADIGAVGDDGAAALAAERNDAVRDAFVDGEPGPSLPAKRLILAPWKPATGADATGRPGVYVELQDAA